MTVDSGSDGAKRPDEGDRAAIGHWEVFAETGELYWSDEVYRIHGLEVGSEIDVASAINAYHPEDRDKVSEYVRRALEEKEDYQFDLRLIRSDGELRHARATGVVRLNPNGDVRSVFGVFQDITEVIRTEQELRKNEALVQALIEHSLVAISIKDLDGRYSFVSPAYTRYFSASAQEAIGKTAEDIVTPETTARVAAADRTIVKTGRALGHDEAFPVELGSSTLLVTKFPIKDTEGAVIGIGTVGIDTTGQKRAEEELRASVQRLEDIAEAASDWFWELDAGLRFTYVSDRYEKVAGVSPELLIGRRPDEVYPRSAERQGEVWKEYFAAVRGHKDFREFIHDDFRQDGLRRVIRNSGKAIFDQEGTFTGYRGTSTDITEQKEMETALQESEKRYRTIFDTATAGIGRTWLKDGRVILSNKMLAQIFGYDTVEEYISGFVFSEHYVNPEDRERLMTSYEKSPGKPIECSFTKRDGSIVIVQAHALANYEEGYLDFFATDVTEQKQFELRLKASEERFRRAVVDAPIPIIMHAEDGEVLMVSKKWAELSGYSLAEIPTIADWTEKAYGAHKQHRNRQRDVIGALYDKEETGEHEARITTASGEKRLWEVRDAPLGRLLDGRRFVISMIVDITEQRRAEERLRQAQKMEAVGQLTGGVAHDFNNLLAIIRGSTEFIQEDFADDDGMTQTILRATDRGAELTHRLLAFSRQQPLRTKSIDLAALVGGMSDMLKRTLGETVEVEIDAEPGLWPAAADPGQVENALLNLSINARDAMPGGGKLIIECNNIRLDKIYVAENDEAVVGDFVVLAVTDSGFGMSADVLDHAFEPFFTTKDVGQGSGLGLSMVYGFAKQSGGHVSIYSEEALGTTVRLYLPREEGAQAKADKEETSDVPLGRGEAVLVIEDDPAVRELAVMTLDTLGYRVTSVPEAASARALLDGGDKFDLVLSDVVLPGGMSGPDFAEEIRDRFPDLKIIFMSGYPAEAAKRNGFLGSDSVLLNKPFRRRQLAEALRDALE